MTDLDAPCRRSAGCAVALCRGAQTPRTAAASPLPEPPGTAFRLSTTTADGDTGLWYVPTAEVLARGKWSASGYRVGLNYRARVHERRVISR